MGGGFLLYGDSRGEPLNRIHIGLAHEGEKLAGIGREAFHIAALTLGVEGVEGQRRLARSGQPGDDDEAVAR